MYHSYSQLPVSSFSAQQLITMGHAIQAESDAKAMAEAQARAQAQAHAEVMFPTQVQAGGHSTVMTQAKRKTNAMLTGKARKKATKFHTLMSKTKNGAPMQLKKATRPLNAYIAFRSKSLLTFRRCNHQLKISQAFIPRSSRATSRRTSLVC